MTEEEEEQRRHEENVERINREFYRQCPARYFQQRLYAFALMSGRVDVVGDALREGVEIGVAKLTNEDWGIDDDEMPSYLTAEGQVVLYTAAEALLRLIIAHYPIESASPALNLAAVTLHSEFYDDVRKHFLDCTEVQLDHLIERTIHGFVSPGAMPEIDDPAFSAEAAEQGKANLRGVLRYLADFVLNEDVRHMNNAAKHGFTLRTGVHGFRLGGRTPDERPMIDQSGEALSCLSVRKVAGTRQLDVEQVIVWSNPVRTIALIDLIIQIMDSVWSVGRHRHTRAVGVTLRLFDTMGIGDIMRLSRTEGPTTGEGFAFIEIPNMRLPLGIRLD